jgi:hypothetical protein
MGANQSSGGESREEGSGSLMGETKWMNPLDCASGCCKNEASSRSSMKIIQARTSDAEMLPPESDDATVMDLPASNFPLHQAADKGDEVAVERLISWGNCDVNGVDEVRTINKPFSRPVHVWRPSFHSWQTMLDK